jgi:hypothetical protein
VAVEIRPGARFEEMALNLFGLAQDGQTNPEGMPGPLQAAIFAREFADVSYFAKPPLPVQGMLFGILAAVVRALGYGDSYPKCGETAGTDLSSGEGDGPPFTGRVRAGVLALAIPLFLLACSSFFGGGAAERPRASRPRVFASGHCGPWAERAGVACYVSELRPNGFLGN